ncbi:MAG: hypothetical protein PHR53_09510, partial [Bacteroidales bacterium]|nr:hypothetical protein [Bacteroidales bacterium]
KAVDELAESRPFSTTGQKARLALFVPGANELVFLMEDGTVVNCRKTELQKKDVAFINRVSQFLSDSK